MQSSLDSGTPSQFGCNKGVVRSTLRALCFLAGSFTYKTGRRICLCAGCGHKVRIPSLEYSKDPRSGVLHRERLATNTKYDSSVYVSEGGKSEREVEKKRRERRWHSGGEPELV
ncbi:hypothetical protein FQN60_001933 [Etheostoma spectabile]|uniref:Uncharacterized protein n=1 Tax=Etheostoma spectabile TaxID=54343 RepID=A0A5J5DCS8_9PERO|nr:hypothetical protein FQN60_001933 [Etheostoma spectabile]